MTADITVVGLGISCTEHLTPEGDRAIRAANEVLFVDTGVATRAFLEQRCPRVTDLYREGYVEGRDRVHTYHHMAARVVRAAQEHGPVVFAVQGHPTVFCYPPFLVREAAGLLGLSVVVQPGISSLACLFSELMVDPGPLGIQMYEATDVLLRRRPLQPDVPLVLWQVGTLESRIHSGRASGPERFVRFRDHLLKFYPPTHVATAFYASPHPLAPSRKHAFALGQMLDHAAELDGGVTLYVPPAEHRPILDRELWALLDSADHLDRISG